LPLHRRHPGGDPPAEYRAQAELAARHRLRVGTLVTRCLPEVLDVWESLGGVVRELRWVRGVLAPGFDADLAVLEVDPLAAPMDEVRAMRVRLTMVGGEIVHGQAP
jgi:hypothetical protein